MNESKIQHILCYISSNNFYNLFKLQHYCYYLCFLIVFETQSDHYVVLVTASKFSSHIGFAASIAINSILNSYPTKSFPFQRFFILLLSRFSIQ